MSSSDLTSQIILMTGSSVLSFVFGFIASKLTQRSAKKADNEKLLREQIEKVYTLTNQAETWFRIQMWKALKLFGEEMTISPVFGFIHVKDVDDDLECPFEEIQTIIEMYLPSMEKEANRYLYNLGLMRIVRNITSSGENEEEIKVSLYGFCSRGIWTKQKEPKLTAADAQQQAMLAFAKNPDELENTIRKYLHIVVEDFGVSQKELRSLLKKHKLITRTQLK